MVELNVSEMAVGSSCLIVLFMTFFVDHLSSFISIIESGLLKPPITTVELFISSFNYVSFISCILWLCC